MILQRLVNHGVRVIHNKRKYDRIDEMKTKYYCSDINRLAETEFRKLVMQMQSGESSYVLNNLLVQSSYNRTRRTNYVCKTYKTNIGQRSVRNRATVLLNAVQYTAQ